MIAASTPGCRWEPKECRRLCSVGAIWSMANAKRPRRSSGAVVWFKPRAQTDIAPDYKISSARTARGGEKVRGEAANPSVMAPLDLLNHLLNFVAPAFAVGFLCALLGRISMRKSEKSPAWWVVAATNFIVGVAVLSAGL